MSYTCATCGKSHDDLPDIASDRPDYWWTIPEAERERRIVLTPDTCIVDREHYFIRGVIEIPIHGSKEVFGFGVWVTQKDANFQKYLENFESAEIGPFFGWLSTRLTYYKDDTLSLKTMAHFRGGKLRPAIELEHTDHPLSVDQCRGIPLAKAWEIVHHYLPDA
jgi:hypothetical protein